MRLSKKEVQKILQVVDQQLVQISFQKAELFLFGSRMDDSKRGGDIDLVLVLEKKEDTSRLQIKLGLLVSLKEALGDQKIDFKILNSEELKNDVFFQTAAAQKISLKKWG